MSARQLIVLVIAAIAAVGALLLIRGMGARSEEPEADVAAVVGEQVLVAARDIAQGAPLTPSDLAVAAFPPETVTPAFISITAQPSAQADYVGAVTRRAFVKGEPIINSSVIQAEGRGLMAAQLQPGFRAVAIEIDAATAAGGYIQPNDHVDVIVTTRQDSQSGRGEDVFSDIVLEDVRVLALGETTQTQAGEEGPQQLLADVAVLELTAEDAAALALANEAGDISLALRGVQAETVGMGAATSRAGNNRQSGGVRVHAFGRVSGDGG